MPLGDGEPVEEDGPAQAVSAGHDHGGGTAVHDGDSAHGVTSPADKGHSGDAGEE